MSIKERVKDHLTVFEHTVLVQGNKGSNADRVLSGIHLWQEVEKLADERLKAAWKAAQASDGLIPCDDDLRKLGKGEHIVVESKKMSCVAKINDPRQCFDQKAFIAAIAKKYKLKVTDLAAIAEKCKTPGQAPLQKRVLEAAQ